MSVDSVKQIKIAKEQLRAKLMASSRVFSVSSKFL